MFRIGAARVHLRRSRDAAAVCELDWMGTREAPAWTIGAVGCVICLGTKE